MPETFGVILKKSWSYFTSHVMFIGMSALVFGVVLYSAQSMLAHGAMGTVEDRFSGLSTKKMQEYSERIQQGDQQALQEMMTDIGLMGSSGVVDEQKMKNMSRGFILSLLPALSIYLCVSYVLLLLSMTYYLVLALQKKKSDNALLQTPQYILPLLGVWIWSFLRSFAWIPFIGVIPAIILGPRFSFAGIILIKEKKGVRESVALSYERTKGYWARITGYLCLMGLCVFGVGIVCSMILDIIGMFVPLLRGVLSSALIYVYIAFGVIFTVYMADTIMMYPMKPQKVVLKK